MKQALVILLCGLFLTACTNVDNSPSGTAATQTDTSSVIEDTTQEMATENIVDLTGVDEWNLYCSKPDKYIVFQYDPDAEYDYPGMAFDRSEMKVDSFYAVNDGDVYLIADQGVSCWDVTSENIYYVLHNEPTKVYRADLDGKEQVVVYQSGIDHVTDIEYSGIDANGELILALNNNLVIKYDILSLDTVVLFEAHMISDITYFPDSLAFTENNNGSVIYWSGYLDDSGNQGSYLYFVNTDNMEQRS